MTEAVGGTHMDWALAAARRQQAETDPQKLLGQGKTREAFREVGEHFEGMFLSIMLEKMFESVPTDGPFGGGSSEKIWRSMQLQEYGKEIAKAGGIGIADMVENQLLQLQEVGR